METHGKLFIVIGIIFLLIGIFFVLRPDLPLFGRLPGDITIKKDNFRVYFPITTSIVLSILLTFLFWILSRWNFWK